MWIAGWCALYPRVVGKFLGLTLTPSLVVFVLVGTLQLLTIFLLWVVDSHSASDQAFDIGAGVMLALQVKENPPLLTLSHPDSDLSAG